VTHLILRGAAALAFLAALSQTPAFAHAVCGDRIFPATLAIDDPGVTDELALTWDKLPKNSSGQVEYDANVNWAKTIFPDFALSIQAGPSWLTSSPQAQGSFGWDDIITEAKYQFLCDASLEFMASAGLSIDWGNTGTGGMGATYNTYTPVLDVGFGFGTLPTSLNVLRPVAITAEISENFPGQSWSQGSQNPNVLNWGFTVQYSLPYFSSHVAEIDNSFFKHLIPLTEFAFSAPISNVPPGGYGVTGTIQPGAVYMADKWQFALEAIIPINRASGHDIGVIAQLDLFMDDIFPDTLGKPIFGGK
jgi:hypothetical protein